ncbi:MAG: tetratricopeptide repeat protein, partial [Smithella sp.]
GHVSLANAHALNKEPRLAFDILRNALKTAPDARDIFRAMARLYAAQKDFQSAESQYRKILDKNPNDLEVKADLGNLMLIRGDFKGAEKEYADIKRRIPGQPLGYMKLSALYIIQHKWDKAIGELEQVLRINPQDWRTINDLAYLLSEYGKGKKDIDRALVLVEKARSFNPENPAMQDTLGWVYYRKGDMNQALNWLGKAQSKAPGNPVINYHLGKAYYSAGNSGKAKEYLHLSLASKVSFPGKDDAEKTLAGIR